jgi:hypothetical protein
MCSKPYTREDHLLESNVVKERERRVQGIKETQQSLNRVSVRIYESRLRGVLGVSETNICEEGVLVHRTVQAPWPRRSQLSIDALARQWGFGGWREPEISLEIQRVWANQSLECVTSQQLLTD